MSQQFTSDSPTWDEIRALRKPRTESVWLPMNGELLDQIAALEQVVAAAEKLDETEHRTPEAPKLRTQLEALRAEAEGAAVQFTFTELTRKQYRALVDACPSDADGWKWNEDQFAPLLIAACATRPELGDRAEIGRLLLRESGVKADDLLPMAGPAVEIWEEWSEFAGYLLYGAAYQANTQGTAVPFSVTATARTPASQPSSTSASETAGA